MKQEFKIGDGDDGRKLQRVVRKYFSNLSLGEIQKLFRKGEIKINGKKAKSESEIFKGDILTVFTKVKLEEKERRSFKVAEGFFKKNFDLIYEDEEILVLNKAAGPAVHPGTNHYHGKTMIDLARFYLEKKSDGKDELFIQLVHRLDADTSGVLLFAKTARALRSLNEQMKSRETEKKYYALVSGKFDGGDGVLKMAVKRVDGARFNKVVVAKKSDKDAKHSITRYSIKEYFGRLATLMDIKLETGRMHQIRVHMESRGHPLVLDQMYGDFKLNKKFTQKFGLKRQFLHAYYLKIKHPSSGNDIFFKAPLKPDLEETLGQLRHDTKK